MEAQLSMETVVVIVVVLALGSFAKAVTGIGLPVFAVPIMASMIGMERTVVIMVIPTVVSNGWLAWTFRSSATLNRDLPIVLGTGFVGVALGSWALASLNDQVMFLILALWTWVYLILAVFKPELKMPMALRRPLSPFVGVIAGIMQGATGVSGPVLVTYFHSLKIPKETYLFSVTLTFLVLASWQVFALVPLGLFTLSRMYEGLLALIPTVVMIPLGVRLARVMSPRAFNNALLVVLFLTSLRLFQRGLFGG